MCIRKQQKKKVPKQGDILSLRIKIHSISHSPYQFGNVYLSIILVDKGRCVFLSRVLQSYSTRHVLKGLFHHVLPCCWMLLHCRGHFREFADEGLIITTAWQRKKKKMKKIWTSQYFWDSLRQVHVYIHQSPLERLRCSQIECLAAVKYMSFTWAAWMLWPCAS